MKSAALALPQKPCFLRRQDASQRPTTTHNENINTSYKNGTSQRENSKSRVFIDGIGPIAVDNDLRGVTGRGEKITSNGY